MPHWFSSSCLVWKTLHAHYTTGTLVFLGVASDWGWLRYRVGCMKCNCNMHQHPPLIRDCLKLFSKPTHPTLATGVLYSNYIRRWVPELVLLYAWISSAMWNVPNKDSLQLPHVLLNSRVLYKSSQWRCKISGKVHEQVTIEEKFESDFSEYIKDLGILFGNSKLENFQICLRMFMAHHSSPLWIVQVHSKM